MKEISFISTFVFLFLLIYRPFYLSDLQLPLVAYAVHVLGYAVITFCVGWMNYAIVVNFFNEATKNWCFRKELIWNLTNFITIGLGNYSYAAITRVITPGLTSMFGLLVCTTLIGILPVTIRMFIRVLVAQQSAVKKQAPEQAKVEDAIVTEEETPIADNVLTLTFQGKQMWIREDAFLAAQSVRNDLVLFVKTPEEELKSVVVRGTLRGLMEQLDGRSGIYQCHRSYVANLNKVIDAHVTASGGSLKIEGLKKFVPVSRSQATMIGSIVTTKLNSYL